MSNAAAALLALLLDVVSSEAVGDDPDVLRRFGSGFTRRNVGNSGTSKTGDPPPRYIIFSVVGGDWS